MRNQTPTKRKPRSDRRTLAERLTVPIDRMSMPVSTRRVFKAASGMGDYCCAADVYHLAYEYRSSPTRITEQARRRAIQALRLLKIVDMGRNLVKAVAENSAGHAIAGTLPAFKEKLRMEAVYAAMVEADVDQRDATITSLRAQLDAALRLRPLVKKLTQVCAQIWSDVQVPIALEWALERAAGKAPKDFVFPAVITMRKRYFGERSEEVAIIVPPEDAVYMIRNPFPMNDWHSCSVAVCFVDGTRVEVKAKLGFRPMDSKSSAPVLVGSCVFPSRLTDKMIDRIVANREYEAGVGSAVMYGGTQTIVLDTITVTSQNGDTISATTIFGAECISPASVHDAGNGLDTAALAAVEKLTNHGVGLAKPPG